MSTTELTEIMDGLLKLTRDKLISTYRQSEGAKTRIIFPKKRDGKIRVSEQEMRFAFVEAFNEGYSNYSESLYYAVEVPTKDLYDFRGTAPQCGHGRSAMFDVVIYDAEKRPLIYIEFKGNNPVAQHYDKDFFKLEQGKDFEESPDALRYFIGILKNTDGGTLESLLKKCKGHPDIRFKFLNLATGEYLDLKL